jgi:hypothetical protein
MEQRANIKFCFKTGKTATEIFQLIKQVYGDSALSCAQVFTAVKMSEDDERNVRPTAFRTRDMNKTVRELI